jgi:hypothetical protein
MDMVAADMPFEYLDIHTRTYLSNELSQAYSGVLVEHRLAVLRYPYNVVLDVKYTMRRLSVILHGTASLIKSSSKGEGFSPIPRVGH